MKQTTGFYPRLKVDTSASGAVGQAGGVVLTETITATGLGRELSAALAPWRKPLAVHDPAKVLTAPGSFLSAGVCAWRAHGDEVASVGDLGDQVVVKVGEVSGGKTPRRR